jgi:hypothetical protein
VHAGFRNQRAAERQFRLAVPERVLIERRLKQVPMNRLEIFETEFVGAEGAVADARLLHEFLPDAERSECLWDLL